MSVQATTLIDTALKKIGVYQSGETPSAADKADAFAALNSFMDELSTQRLTMNGIQLFSLAVVSGHSPYTIGIGGDFNQVRPLVIDDVTLTLAGSTPTTIPLTPMTQDEYANLAAKTVQAQIATSWYYNETYVIATPLGGLFFWPILNDATVTINIWVPVAITAFATPTTTYTILPGWQAMLENNLAVALADLFGVDCPARVAAAANRTMLYVKSINVEPSKMGVDNGLLKSSAQMGGGNWLTGP